jgi:environmental stress-induced protein Ves
MRKPVLLRKDSYQRSQWKNGLGHTDQIAIEPPDANLRAGDYAWRVSTAEIAADSDFSLFPDHDRALVILAGEGVRLTHRDEESEFADTIELQALEPYEFPGDVRSRCELVRGPVKDLSVFFRKVLAPPSIEVVPLDAEAVWEWVPTASWNLLHAARGSFEVAVSEDETVTLAEGDTFRLDGASEDQAEAFPVVPHGPGSALVSIRLWNA